MHLAKNLVFSLAVLGLVIAAPVHADGPKGTTVWDIVQASAAHNTLEAALDCTGLSAALEGNGQITLFAPTDVAFDGFGLDETNICTVFTTDQLSAILANHVARGRRDDGEVVASETIRMLSRNRFEVEVDLVPTVEVLVGGAKLDLNFLNIGDPGTPFDIANGLIHFVGEGIVGIGLP